MELSLEAVELLRDIRFRRTKKLQVRNEIQALDFINDVGFCFAFTAKNSELPCLWHAATGQRNPTYPHHTHHDPFISLVWNAKDTLVAERKIYYGKALKKRPTMISLKFFPYFYALMNRKENSESYLAEYIRGELSPTAKKIMDALTENSPQITADLRLASGFAHPKKRYEFDKGMAELQMKMYIIKIAEFYDPFTFLWELVPKHFEKEVRKASRISIAEAREKILFQYFENLYVSTLVKIQLLFGWKRKDILKTLACMVNRTILRDDIKIINNNERWFGISNFENISKQP